jgi:DNA (cytosine-5)-methyltransferase 1
MPEGDASRPLGRASAADFGVPQSRKRLIVIVKVRGPAATHGHSLLPHVTTKEAIGDLPDAGEFGITGIHNHEPTMHSADMVARFRSLREVIALRDARHDMGQSGVAVI